MEKCFLCYCVHPTLNALEPENFFSLSLMLKFDDYDNDSTLRNIEL